MKKFYITTPLYYVNDKLHLGHAYSTIAVDILARWKRLRKEDVFFLTGTDEHGEKIYEAAKAKGVDVKDWCDYMVNEDKKLWKYLEISYDDFIRTTEKRHENTVKKVFSVLKERGYVYKSFYKGPYCVPCERFLTLNEVKENNGRCPDCGREVKEVKEEEAYFFKLSEFREELLKYYDENPDFIKPDFRKNEMVNIVKEGLNDLCITRVKERVPWGIEVPGDEDKVFYVWFDALINYITVPGVRIEDGKLKVNEEFWPADIHFIGKEITRFHAIIWPAILIAAGSVPPRKIFAHGWWTVEGEKMSKSKGNVVDPYEVTKEIGVDAFRLYLFRSIPFGQDGDFSYKRFLDCYNNDLANNFGNIISRVSNMIIKYQNGVIRRRVEVGENIVEKVNNLINSIDEKFENLKYYEILEEVFSLCDELNSFIEEQAPWKLYKENKEKVYPVLYRVFDSIKIITNILYPFM
ncbi:MAG: methionine--tRNA ligase, partial [Caldiserica bacterium]